MAETKVVGNDKNARIEIQTMLPQNLSRAQYTFITQKTPEQFIKTRIGPGGIQLQYVEVGYVINVLNRVFGWDWDFRIIEQQVGHKQVWVRGQLVVKLRDHMIVKDQFGGSTIKFYKGSTDPVSIADELKAASMLGIAADIYWKDLDNWFQEE